MTPAILLVDDDVFLLTLTAELLSGLGYQVRTARNGGEALAVLDHGHAVDLLVTDVQMPGLHGFELRPARAGPQAHTRCSVLHRTCGDDR